MCKEIMGWVSILVLLVMVGHARASLPQGWSSQDIGTTGGSAEEIDGTWTVSGDGADVWGTSDAFHFVYVPISGDIEITARVVGRGSGSDLWAKGGVMIRQTLSGGSKNALMAITGGEGGGLTFQNRPITGGRSYSAHGNPVATPPHWVRLRRQGDMITAYSSANGLDWIQQPDGSLADSTANPVEIPMAAEVLVGLCVTSHVTGQIRTYTFDNVTVGRPRTASQPEPQDSATIPETWTQLSWTPGPTAETHDVYFGRNFTDVTNGTGGTYRGNLHLAAFTVGLPESPCPEGLIEGATYYWRVDEVESDGLTKHTGSVWRFTVASQKACRPVPPDGALFVETFASLTWTAGVEAQSHTIHFGDDFETVANSEGGRTQPTTEYPCRMLEYDKTYYWRVDEFDGQTTHRGDVWSFTTRSREMASTTFHYVDANHPDARDSNPGDEMLPWKTIQRGVRSLLPGDVLLVKAGIYRETVILDRNGTEANPIGIWAYPGDEGRAIINAAEPIAHWQRCAGPEDCAGNPYWEHIYVADVAALVAAHPQSDFAVRQLFQHGRLLDRSRYPDAGWSYPSLVTDPGRTFVDHSLSQPDGYFVGSVCHVKTSIWHLDQIPITDFSQRAIALERRPRYDISTRFGYYITSIVGQINAEGEWAYDPVEKKLFLWPVGEVPEGVEFTYRQYCVRTYAGSSWTILRGLNMHNAYEHGIWLYGAHDMTVENNTVEHAFTFGIHLQSSGGPCSNNRILNNAVRHCCFRGINVGGDVPYCQVEGNYVYATGTEHFGGDLMHGPSHAVYVSGPFAQVYNNRIDRTGYTALYLDGDLLGREISCNYITNVGLSLSDGGGMYMGGFYDGPETDHIHHNIIEDAIGCLSMYRPRDTGLPVTIERYAGDTPGIYIDERGNHRTVEDNTVIGSHMAGIFFHWAPDNVVRNNTLYGNRVAQIYFSGRDQPQERLVDDILLDNIMFATEASQKTLFLGINYDDVHFGQSDRNDFFNPYDTRHIFVSRYSGAGGAWIQEDLTLRQWHTLSGYDADSRDYSCLSRSSDITIMSPVTSRVVFNPSLEPVEIDLQGQTYCDVDGNKLYGTVILEPFESKVLISADFAVP